MELFPNERQILEDKGYFEGTRRIVLTNKRMLFFKKKGFFGDYSTFERELPLEDVSSCTLIKSSVDGNQIKSNLNNGKSHFLVFPAKLTALAFGSIYDFDQTKSSITDKWLVAINQQLNNKSEASPLDVLKLRLAKGEITKKEFEELKRTVEG